MSDGVDITLNQWPGRPRNLFTERANRNVYEMELMQGLGWGNQPPSLIAKKDKVVGHVPAISGHAKNSPPFSFVWKCYIPYRNCV